MILGDNIFYADGFSDFLISIKDKVYKSSKNFIFGYKLNAHNINDYGVIEYYKSGKPKSLIEKPKKFISNDIIPGLYFYNKNCIKFLNKLRYSKRGELEISDINNILLKKQKLEVIKLVRTAWFDVGTTEKLFEASTFIRPCRKKWYSAGCIEEIALNNNFISKKDFKKLISISREL